MRRTDHPHNTTAPGATPLIGLPSLHPCLANNQHEALKFRQFHLSVLRGLQCSWPAVLFTKLLYFANFPAVSLVPFSAAKPFAPLKLWLHRAGQARPWVCQPWQLSASWSWSSASSASSASNASRASSASSASRITGAAAAAGHAWCTRCKHTAYIQSP